MAFIESVLFNLGKVRSRLFTAIIAPSFGSIGRNTAIVPPFRCKNLNQINLGSGVTIHRDCWIQALAKNSSVATPVVSIGNNVSIGMGATISGVHRILIDDYVLLGRNVYISDHGHEYQDVSVPICLQGIRKIAEVRIGWGAWLGQNVVILPGVSIGRNSVIGANSVVSTSVPDFCVAVGSPAKVIRRYDSVRLRWEKTEQQ